MKRAVRLTIRIEDPIPRVAYALQRGKAEHVGPVREGVFEFDALCTDDGRWSGAFVQGPSGGKFIYIGSGTHAGDGTSCWTRRAKIPLAGITEDIIQAHLATPGSRIECTIAGRAKDGGPCCPTVPLLGNGWETRLI